MERLFEVVSRSEAETRAAGVRLAAVLAAGDVVLLEGDLGTGKTVFARGLAEGLGADPAEVSSPTFALVHEYGPAGRPPVLAHVDFYRLENEADRRTLGELGLEELRVNGSVLAIEWPRSPWSDEPGYRVRLEDLGASRRRIVVTSQ